MSNRFSILVSVAAIVISVYVLVSHLSSPNHELAALREEIAKLRAEISARNFAEPLTATPCGAIVCDVSILVLLAHPGRYDGQRVGIRGVYATGFEMSGLFPTNELVEPHNGIWVDGMPETASRHMVMVSGTFHAGASGHLGNYIGRISDIIMVLDMTANKLTRGPGAAEALSAKPWAPD